MGDKDILALSFVFIGVGSAFFGALLTLFMLLQFHKNVREHKKFEYKHLKLGLLGLLISSVICVLAFSATIYVSFPPPYGQNFSLYFLGISLVITVIGIGNIYASQALTRATIEFLKQLKTKN